MTGATAPHPSPQARVESALRLPRVEAVPVAFAFFYAAAICAAETGEIVIDLYHPYFHFHQTSSDLFFVPPSPD